MGVHGRAQGDAVALVGITRKPEVSPEEVARVNQARAIAGRPRKPQSLEVDGFVDDLERLGVAVLELGQIRDTPAGDAMALLTEGPALAIDVGGAAFRARATFVTRATQRHSTGLPGVAPVARARLPARIGGGARGCTRFAAFSASTDRSWSW